MMSDSFGISHRGREGRYVWGWKPRPRGPGLIVDFGAAERGLYQEVVDARPTTDLRNAKRRSDPRRRRRHHRHGLLTLGAPTKDVPVPQPRVTNDDWEGASKELQELRLIFTGASGGNGGKQGSSRDRGGDIAYPSRQ
jgi:hypothetical protein